MPIVIKEMHIRTVVEKRIMDVEVSDEIVRKIENRVLGKLSENNRNRQPATRSRRRER